MNYLNLNRTHVKNCSCKMVVCRCPVDYMVFYNEEKKEWIIERTSDKREMEHGSLEDMILLIEGDVPKYINARRAHWAEDLRHLRHFLARIWDTPFEYEI